MRRGSVVGAFVGRAHTGMRGGGGARGAGGPSGGGVALGLAALRLALALAAPAAAAPVVDPLQDRSVYPIAVWAMPARTAPEFAALGVNVFVAGEDNPLTWCDSIAASGCVGFVHWRARHSAERRAAVAASPGFLGWMHGDEPDNPAVVDDVFLSYHVTPERLQADYEAMQASSTPAPMYINLGQGLANGINQSTPDHIYPAFCRAADVVCYDVYPTSTQENGTSRLHLVARGVERLRRFAGPDKPVWVWLECTRINGGRTEVGNRAPLPHELRAQVWMAIVHGADGIGYFPHQFNPYRGGPAAIPADLKAEMKRTNALLHALAPILRAGTRERVPADAGAGERVSAALWQRGEAALLAVVNLRAAPARARVTLPATVAALAPLGRGDSATAPTGGALVAALAPYEVALYAAGLDAATAARVPPYAYPDAATAGPATPAAQPPAAAQAAVPLLDTIAALPRQSAAADAAGTQWCRTHRTRLAVPCLSAAPRLDGRLDPDEWSLAAPLAPFAAPDGRGWPAQQTSGWIGWRADELYLAFRCAEPVLDSLVTRYPAQWRNDCVELWIDPDNRRTSFAHLIAAASGALQAERTVQDEWGEGRRDEGWQPRVACRAGRESGAWTVELVVALADVGLAPPGPGEPGRPAATPDSPPTAGTPAAGERAFAFDAARERQPQGGENSVWTVGKFNAASQFGEAVLASAPVVLAGGVLRNATARPVSARVEVLVSAPRPAAEYAAWDDQWTDVARQTMVVVVPPRRAGTPGQVALLDGDLLARVPAGGRVRLALQAPGPAQWEEFIVRRAATE